MIGLTQLKLITDFDWDSLAGRASLSRKLPPRGREIRLGVAVTASLFLHVTTHR